MLFTPNPYTFEDLKSYKGLEAYNQIVSGLVRDVQSKEINRKYLARAKVGLLYFYLSLYYFNVQNLSSRYYAHVGLEVNKFENNGCVNDTNKYKEIKK